MGKVVELPGATGHQEEGPGRHDQQGSDHERRRAPHVAWRVSAMPRFPVQCQIRIVEKRSNSRRLIGRTVKPAAAGPLASTTASPVIHRNLVLAGILRRCPRWRKSRKLTAIWS
jgi:hypothetical protein